MGSYPLSSLAPTSVEVEFGCDNSHFLCVGRMEVPTGGQRKQNTLENKREGYVIYSKDEFDVHHGFIMLFIIIFLVVVFTCLTIYIFSVVVYKCCFLGRVNKVRKPFLFL